MKLLIDTHTFLWFVRDEPNLSAKALKLIEDPSNEILLSSASLWEMAIKISTGKMTLPESFDVWANRQFVENEITLLGIAISHIAALTTLPFHHKDPFDRMIVVQSMSERIPVISRDEAFDAYAITRLW